MSLRAGERIAERFEVLRRLGEGGMGIVFEAIDHDLGGRVALKTVRELDPASLLRFKNEFRALAAISHPSLVALHELAFDGARWFFTMELVEDAVDVLAYVRAPVPSVARATPDAPTLAAGPRGEDVPASAPIARAFDEARVRAAFLSLAEGLHALHDAGKLHRDLKPANVLVRPDGRVVILDFGLVAELGIAERARAPHDDLAIEADDAGASSSRVRLAHPTERTVSGTVAYMSPEQAAAEALGEASDWYAVGTMLFEALTGALPFEGMGVLVRKQILDAPRPSDVVAGVPADLDALVAALLARDPADRPGYAHVRAVLSGQAAHEAPASELTFVGRTELLAGLAGALAEASGGARVVRVQGPSGAGKSTLLARFAERARAGATVLAAACLEQESVPYKTIDGIVDALVRALLELPCEARAVVLAGELGSLVRLFPVVARVSTSAPSALVDARAVRAEALEQLAGVVARLASAEPVVMLVDDLQWGDAEGAALLASLVARLAERPVLFVLGHRSEYGSSPALRELLPALRAGRVPLRELDVGMLAEVEARALASACLGVGASEDDVARVVRAGEGLPWLVQELARAVRAGLPHDEIRADRALVRRAARLDPVARRVLDVVALAGRPVTPRSVQAVLGVGALPPELMRPLRAEGFVRGSGLRLDDPIEPFHDRVREGIAAELRGEPRRQLHLALARALRDTAEPEWTAAHLEAAGEREDAAREHERAADLALSVLAVERAERGYRRALALRSPGTEARALVAEKLVHLLTDQARFAEAYELGRSTAAELGIDMPAAFVPPRFAADLAAVLVRLRGRPTEALVELPPMRDARLSTGVRVMAATMKAAYQVRPELCVQLANRAVSLCLEHGNSPDAALGFMVHGAIFRGGILGHHDTGHRFGRLALQLVDRFENERQRAEVCFVVGYFGTSWMRPSSEAEALFAQALEAGLRTGDHFHSGCAVVGTVIGMHVRGVPLAVTLARAAELRGRIAPYRLREPEGTLDGFAHAYALARGEAGTLDAGAHEASLATYGSQHFALAWFLVTAQLALVQGDARRALDHLSRAAPFLASAQGTLHGAELEIWRALALSAAARDLSQRARALPALLTRAARCERWARDCDASFGAKAELLSAEVARTRGATRTALDRYARAAEHAARTGHLPIEALAHARAASLGRDDARRRARAAWDAWGATTARDAL